YYDKDANKISKPTIQKIDLTAAQVAERYVTAIGGKAALDKVTSIATTAAASVQGMNLDMTLVKARGGKIFMDMKVMGNSMQKVVFDGTNGKMTAQGQTMDLPAEMKADFANDKELFPEVAFAKKATLKVSGIEKINGEDSYAIKDGSTVYYYSVASGLKTGETKTQKINGQEVTVPTTYGDYKTVDGVKLPYKISQSMMGQSLDFVVSKYDLNKAKDTDFK
ncbi:MAG: insulinase family protein, partial [Soonwooa sp.]